MKLVDPMIHVCLTHTATSFRVAVLFLFWQRWHICFLILWETIPYFTPRPLLFKGGIDFPKIDPKEGDSELL